MNWKKLEDHVRAIAELRWNSRCSPMHIDGVDYDGVVNVSEGEIILIEITERKDLDKVRSDINKLIPARTKYLSNGVICRCFVVLSEDPTNSMVELGKAHHISVCSSVAFEKDFYDFSSYNTLRSALPFGSAVDQKTGKNDSHEFVSIGYIEEGTEKTFHVGEIVGKLLKKRKIVLTGDYGTGKSRCFREVYNRISECVRDAGAFPVAINLRDHWSSSNALEVLAGHLGNVGISSSIDNVVRLLNSGALVLLLDGFDEVGAQSHDLNIENRRALRSKALMGVRDLIQKNAGAVLITGRSHFFDGDDEMMRSLGLGDLQDVCHLRVPEQFTVEQAQQYMKSIGLDVSVPAWLPKKPLVFQVLAELEAGDISKLFSNELGELQFWGPFIWAVCARESRGVGGSISAGAIQDVLIALASRTRYSDCKRGRLSPREIDEAYEAAVGYSPDQAGRQLLSRMCTLGRIEPESPDRQFVEYNVLDVLRAKGLINQLVEMTEDGSEKRWSQSLKLTGVYHAAAIIEHFDLAQQCFSYLRKFGNSMNSVKLGEIVSILTISSEEGLDFQGLQISGADIPILNFMNRDISGLVLNGSEIDFLFIEGTKVSDVSGVEISRSLIYALGGVSSEVGLPSWIKDTEVVEFDRVSNSSRIKEGAFSPAQKLFLAFVHKIFFQPGAGRKESSLLKAGFGQMYDRKLGESIIKTLIAEGVVQKIPGKEGWIYKPVRKHTERMNRIRSELTLSEDPLWVKIAALS